MKKILTKNSKSYLISLITIIALFSFVSAGCNVKTNAVGMEDVIYVVADSGEFYELESTLLQVFGKVIYTPQPENLFSIQRVSFDEFAKFKTQKNIMIIAPLNSGSRTSNYISTIIDSTVKEMVAENSEFYFNKRDLWAKNQLVMVVTSPTIEQIKHNILLDSDNLLYQFQDISNKRLLKGLYNAKFEDPKLEGYMLQQYGWIIYVQSDFVKAIEDPNENFMWIRGPHGREVERWIFVHWIDNATPAMLNADFIIENRNRITNKFYRATDDSSYVEIADSYLKTEEVNFEGRYALMTQGLWRMNDQSMGGPFVNYTFYDEETERLYLLDASLYAPKYFKKKMIKQLDVILRSFKTKSELSAERIEELLAAAED